MASKNSKLNISFTQHEQNVLSVLTVLAKKEHKTKSRLAKELIAEALELREDLALSRFAEKRDTGKEKTIKHADAWK